MQQSPQQERNKKLGEGLVKALINRHFWTGYCQIKKML
jgi:hypothetical protein